MATQEVIVNDILWRDLVAELSLITGEVYTAQNVSNSTAYITEQSSLPDDDSPRHEIAPGASKGVISNGIDGIWVKGKNSTVTIVVTVSN